jgi:hypothetical protein
LVPYEYVVKALVEIRPSLSPDLVKTARKYLAMDQPAPKMAIGQLIRTFAFRLPDEPDVMAHFDLVNCEARPFFVVYLSRNDVVFASFPPYCLRASTITLEHGGREYRIKLPSDLKAPPGYFGS